jgi:hypothetical protein
MSPKIKLLSQFQFLDDFEIFFIIGFAQVVQQFPAGRDQRQQTFAGMIVFLVCLEMFGQIADPFGQNRYLHFGRTRVLVIYLKPADQFLLGFLGNAHNFLLIDYAKLEHILPEKNTLVNKQRQISPF